MRLAAFVWALLLVGASSAWADAKNQQLDLYFIDVEGGAATLIVTPAGESLLIDSGYPDYGGRDLKRILHVIKDVAGLDHLDHASVSHWHLDHFGNHAALAHEIKIGNFWDRGIPEKLAEDNKFEERIAAYRAATQNKSKTLKVGDALPLKSGKTPLAVKVVTASRDVIANTGEPNPFASEHVAQAEDPSDNAASVSLLFSFGDFRFLTCGDLTWNVEGKLVTPNNPVGVVDLFMVTHHGLGVSNNPALVHAIDPVVAVECNGPTKGGELQTYKTLKGGKSLKALYQLHRNVRLKADEQTAEDQIANLGETEGCKGVWVKASVAADGESYTVQIGPEGKPQNFETRSR
jgi:competence protein ComEC